MYPTYDNPLVVTHAGAASTDFAAAAAAVLPNKVLANKGNLTASQVLAVMGTVATAGTGTINIGDGTNATRYGTIQITAGLSVGAPLQGKITLTDEGAHMGQNDGTAVNTFTLTYSGTIVVANIKFVIGYFQ